MFCGSLVAGSVLCVSRHQLEIKIFQSGAFVLGLSYCNRYGFFINAGLGSMAIDVFF